MQIWKESNKISHVFLFFWFSILTISCTHTTEFEKTEYSAYPQLNSRNLENYMLEKELSFSRTASIGCGLTALSAGFLVEQDLRAALYIFSIGAICMKYQLFLSERAEVYLKGSGVSVEFW